MICGHDGYNERMQKYKSKVLHMVCWDKARETILIHTVCTRAGHVGARNDGIPSVSVFFADASVFLTRADTADATAAGASSIDVDADNADVDDEAESDR